MKTYQANDRFTLTGRDVTPEGFLVAPGALARTGIQEYRAYELGLDADGVDPMKIIKLYRSPQEVFAPDSLRSFENKPITIEHPAAGVDASNWGVLAKGEVRDVKASGDFMQGTLIIKSKDAIDAIQGGKVELSNGYTFELDWTTGTDPNGRAYDGLQKNIRGNHVAIVDSARCGAACRISDSQPLGVTTMADAKRKVIVDGIPVEVDDTAAAAIDKLTKAHDAAVQRATTAETKLNSLKVGDKACTLDELVKLVGDQATQIETLKKDVMTPEARDAMVAEWAKLIGDAKKLVPALVTDGKTCVAVRREVVATVASKDSKAKATVEAVLGGKTLDAADADVVRAAFNVLVATASDAGTQANDSGDAGRVAAALAGGSKQVADAKPVGRAAFIQKQAEAWKTK
jgi:hypothetical protein